MRIRTLILMISAVALLSACGGGSDNTPSNRAPVAQDLDVNTNEEESVSGQLQASDADGDSISFSLVQTGSGTPKGTLTITGTGGFDYSPNPGEFGDDTFTYRVNDGQANSNDATLTIRINARPQVSDMAIATVADEVISDLVSISDADAGTLTVSINTPTQSGIVAITDASTGAFDYTPTAGYVGPDQFTVLVTDGSAISLPGTVSIDVAQRPVISFALPASIGNESQTEQIAINIDPPSPRDSSVNLTIGGSATASIDYDSPAVQINIPAGSTVIDLPLTIHIDSNTEIGETVDLALVATCSACDISMTDFNHTLTLVDWHGSVQLSTDRTSGVNIIAIEDDATNGVLVGGGASGLFAGSSVTINGLFLAKYDLTAALDWVISLESSAGMFDFVVAPDGNIFVVGAIHDNALQSATVTKLNSNGVVQWSIIYGGILEDVAHKIALDAAGNVYIAGRTENDLAGPSAGSRDLFIAQFDSTGSLNWVRQTGSTNGDAHSVGLTVLPSGNVVVAAQVAGAVEGIPILGSHAVIVISFDVAGTERWRTFIDSPAGENVTAAAAFPSGGVIIAGRTDGELEPGKIRGLYLAKLSDAGVVEWVSQQTDINGSNGSQIADIAVDSGGNIFATGPTFGDWTGDGNSGIVDIYALGFSPLGTLIWTQQFGGTLDDTGTGLGLDGNGNVYIGGRSDSTNLLGFTTPPGQDHSVLVKLGADGVIH